MIQNRKIFILLFLLPISVTFLFAWLFFLSLPIADYWDVLYSGLTVPVTTFSELWQYCWAPFVDQKMVFPKLFIWLASLLTANNHYGLEILFGLVGQLLILLIMGSMLQKTPGLPSNNKAWLLLTISWLLFWPNILIRFQHHWYSTQYTFVLVFAMLSIAACVHFWGTWKGVATSIVFAVISAVSHGTGLIFLLCYLCAIPIVSGWSKVQKSVMVLSALFVVAIIIAQIPPRESMNAPPLNWFAEDPIRQLNFIFRCFGPDGVLRAQTGFLTLLIGLLSCWKLFKLKKLFTRDYFGWLLIFFWGSSVAFLTSVARSSFTSSPFRVYFYFFIIVLISVIVLAVVVYPETFLARKKRNWKFMGIVAVALYLVGCADGVHDAAKLHKRNAISESRLQYNSLLLQEDYKYLFPEPRIQGIVRELHERRLLPQVDNRSFGPRNEVTFSQEVVGQSLYFTPNQAIASGDVLAFPEKAYAHASATCFWTLDGGWSSEQSQMLKARAIDGYYVVIFIDSNGEDSSDSVKEVKLEFSHLVDGVHIGDLPPPLIWSRQE